MIFSEIIFAARDWLWRAAPLAVAATALIAWS